MAEAALEQVEPEGGDALLEINPSTDFLTPVAFTQLRVHMRNFLRGKGVLPSDCEDLFQQAWVRFFQAGYTLNQFENQGAFTACFLQITAHLFIDFLRRKRSRGKVLSFENPFSHGDSDARESVFDISDEPNPEHLTIHRETLRRVEHALDRIPPEQVEALMLAAVDGLPWGALGECIGVCPNTAKSRVHYAREKLKEAVGDKSVGEKAA